MLAGAVELTFELPDNAKECFFEEIQQGTDATLEFQVRPKRPILSLVQFSS